MSGFAGLYSIKGRNARLEYRMLIPLFLWSCFYVNNRVGFDTTKVKKN